MQKFHTDDVHYPDLGSTSDWLKENSLAAVLGSTSDWLKENSLAAQPIRSTAKIWAVHVISMEFLRSLLRRCFARAQVATSRNVTCFLRLPPFMIDGTHWFWSGTHYFSWGESQGLTNSKL